MLLLPPICDNRSYAEATAMPTLFGLCEPRYGLFIERIGKPPYTEVFSCLGRCGKRGKYALTFPANVQMTRNGHVKNQYAKQRIRRGSKTAVVLAA